MTTVQGINELLGTSQSQTVTDQARNELGQEDFMALLVAQLENQDPTKPMDNFEFLSQIAQFSMVNGIDGLQGSFDEVAGSLLGNQGLQAATLLGRDVLSPSNTGHFDGTSPVEGVIELNEPSTLTEIQVRDSAGSLVKTFTVGASSEDIKFSWDGRNEQGETLAAGNYDITAVGNINGESVSQQVVLANHIESVSLDRTTQLVTLNLTNGEVAQLSDVREYR